MLAAGVFGYLMKLQGFPMGPLVLGVILGPIAEENIRNALRASGGNFFQIFHSPIALVLLALTAFSLLLPVIQDWQKKKRSSSL